MNDEPPRELIEFVSSDEGRAACARAGAAGDLVARIDAAEPTSAKEFLRSLADALALPEWFGMNWDALDESLRDLLIAPGSEVVVFVDRFDAWRSRNADEAELFLAIARDAIAHHGIEGRSFRVLVSDGSVE